MARQTGLASRGSLLSPHETDDRPDGSMLVEFGALPADTCSLHSHSRPRVMAVSAPVVDRTHDTLFRGVEFLVEEGQVNEVTKECRLCGSTGRHQTVAVREMMFGAREPFGSSPRSKGSRAKCGLGEFALDASCGSGIRWAQTSSRICSPAPRHACNHLGIHARMPRRLHRGPVPIQEGRGVR
jgi:hypothetical protein